jgi:hypothetical protein
MEPPDPVLSYQSRRTRVTCREPSEPSVLYDTGGMVGALRWRYHTELLLAGMTKSVEGGGGCGDIGGGGSDWCYKTYVYGNPVNATSAAAPATCKQLEEADEGYTRGYTRTTGEQSEDYGDDPLRGTSAVTVRTSLNLLEGGTGCHEW